MRTLEKTTTSHSCPWNESTVSTEMLLATSLPNHSCSSWRTAAFCRAYGVITATLPSRGRLGAALASRKMTRATACASSLFTYDDAACLWLPPPAWRPQPTSKKRYGPSCSSQGGGVRSHTACAVSSLPW